MSLPVEGKSGSSKAWVGLAVFLGIGAVVLLSNRTGEIRTPEGLPVIADQESYNQALKKSHELSAPALQAYVEGKPLTAKQVQSIRESVVLFDAMDLFRPTEFTSFFLCGNAYAALGEYEKADERFRQGISNAQGKTDPAVVAAVADAHHERSIILSKLNRYQDAFNEAELAIKLEPVSAVYFANHAQCALQLGNKQTARIDLKTALALDPNNHLAQMLSKVVR